MKVKTDKLKPGDIIVMSRTLVNHTRTLEKEVMRLLLTDVTKGEVRGYILYSLGSPEKVGQTWTMHPVEIAGEHWRMV